MDEQQRLRRGEGPGEAIRGSAGWSVTVDAASAILPPVGGGALSFASAALAQSRESPVQQLSPRDSLGVGMPPALGWQGLALDPNSSRDEGTQMRTAGHLARLPSPQESSLSPSPPGALLPQPPRF